MSVLMREKETQEVILFVKGAAECIIDRCSAIMYPGGHIAPITPLIKQSILQTVKTMATQALRCIALAIKVGKYTHN